MSDARRHGGVALALQHVGRFTPDAATRISSSPAPGTGAPTLRDLQHLGAPKAVISTARMVGLLLLLLLLGDHFLAVDQRLHRQL